MKFQAHDVAPSAKYCRAAMSVHWWADLPEGRIQITVEVKDSNDLATFSKCYVTEGTRRRCTRIDMGLQSFGCEMHRRRGWVSDRRKDLNMICHPYDGEAYTEAMTRE